jgi:hypothetical protein
MFYLTSKWRNSSLVKRFENGTNLLIPTTTQCKMYRVFSHLHNSITEWFQSHKGNIFSFCTKYEVLTMVKVQIVVFLVILLSSLIDGSNIAETLKMKARGSSKTSVTTCGLHGVIIQTTKILLFVCVSYIFVFSQRS